MSVIAVGSLEVSVHETESNTYLRWRGEADDRDPRRTILPFLDQTAGQAAAAGKDIVIDFEDLHFMNSSCIGLVITFLKSLQAARVRASVIFDTRHDWQTLSMKCTRTIFTRSTYITIVDRGSIRPRTPR